MKNKLIYPIYGILFFFLLSVGKLAISKQYDEIEFPGTRWLETDNFVGASKANLKNNIKIEPIEFAEDISIPELPNLLDIPLTEEDK
tara:strand:- start:94 stop:354 length:261 start_codon:yes stop_codon:yes gene_type:complete